MYLSLRGIYFLLLSDFNLLQMKPIFNKLVYSVLTHQHVVNNTEFLLHVLVLPNHFQANIFYMEVHLMCTYVMGSKSVDIISYQFKI